ncbi:MAG: hypothetical protein QOE28_3205 [Solirubrobacteraceae bacterium]|nr:hypothetical protein [Solirubrobacteraceae bacterium]
MLRRMRSESGAASIEYAGVLAILAGVFAAIVLLGLGPKISEAIRVAVCQITGGHCTQEAAAPEKCLTSSTTTTSKANVLIAVVKIDKDSTLIRENYSDGSSKFTILDNTEAAGELFAGAKGKIGRYGINWSASAEAGAALAGAKVFEFPDQKSADEFQSKVQAAGGFDGIVRDLAGYDDTIPFTGIKNPLGGVNDAILDLAGVDKNADLPTPTETYMEGRAFIQGNADAAAGIGLVDANLKAMLEGAGAVKVTTSGKDKGDVEFTVELKGSANGNLTAATLGAGIKGEAAFTATISLDAQNGYKPDKLVLKGTAGYTGGADLQAKLEGSQLKDVSKALKEVSLTGHDGTGHGLEFSAELDLKDPQNLQATLDAITGAGNPTAMARLAQRIDTNGTLGLDTYDLSQTESEGEIKVGLGVGGGGGASSSSESQTGRSGKVRYPGGSFQPRVCAQAGGPDSGGPVSATVGGGGGGGGSW